MKKKLLIIGCALVGSIWASAQTLNVYTGQVCTAVVASAEKMPYTENGSMVTIAGKTFAVAEIDSMVIDNSLVVPNSVQVTYSGTSAKVRISGNIAQHITAMVDGAHVSITQGANVTNEITYTLEGSSTNGSFYTTGSYKMTLALNGVSLTNPNGAAIDIQNGKRIAVELVEGTTNTLVDSANGAQKACFNVKGHPEFKGAGTLNLTGNTKHAFKSGEYTELKASTGTINVIKSAGDGMHVGQYLNMKGGIINMSNIGDDGLQVEITNNAADELNGQALISGGSMQITVGATAAKGLRADSLITISGGTLNITTTGGGAWDSGNQDTKSAACIATDTDLIISGGTITCKSTGAGGKGINIDGNLTISNGKVDATTTGAVYTYNSYYCLPKGIKAEGNITISGGEVAATTTGSVYRDSGPEAIESKGTLTISGGIVMATATDDAINSGGDMTFTGGYTFARSTSNDGIDANGNMYVKGGIVYAAGSREPEVAFDADSEQSKQLYVTGGTLIGFGGLERGASVTQPYIENSSYTANTAYALYHDNTLLVAFKAPQTTGGTGVTVSCGALTSGTAYTLKSGVTITGGTSYFGGYYFENATVSGGTATNVTAASGTYSGSGGGPGSGGGGRPNRP